jgi:hypothetical protein
MKHIPLFVFMAFSSVAFTQTQDSLVWRYASIKYTLGGFNTKSRVEVDYGDKVQGWFRKADLLEDENGKSIQFKTPVDALNWMSIRGWEMVTTYQTTESVGIGATLVYHHFILKRREVYGLGR